MRLRERFQKTSTEGLHDYEVLELLLTYAIPRRDVKPIAKNLMIRFKTLSGVMEARGGELTAVQGIGGTAANLIRLVKEISVLISQRKVEGKNAMTNPQHVVDFAWQRLAGLPHEAFMVIFLNVQNEVLGHRILNEGTVDQVAVYPRRIIELALEVKSAGMILVHNHPSGHTQPSEEDKRLTQSITKAGALMDIRVLDHIIVGKGGYTSFREKGLLGM